MHLGLRQTIKELKTQTCAFSTMNADPSIVHYHGARDGFKCFCGHKDTQTSYALWAERLTVQDYQDLINRGWRRSGKYIFKPALDQTCCPHYAIRFGVQDFKMNRSQMRVIQKVNRYLSTGNNPSEAGGGTDKQSSSQECDDSRGLEQEEAAPGKRCPTPAGDGEPLESIVRAAAIPQVNDLVTSYEAEEGENKTQKPEVGVNTRHKKAESMRLENRQQKQAQSKPERQRKVPINESKTKVGRRSRSLESFLEDIAENPAHKMEVRLVRSSPPSEEFLSSYQEGYRIYKKYQMTIHKETEDNCKETFFKEFLVDSPLEEQQSEKDGGFPGFGSFYQLYLLDGKIIAVGILDILPHGVSGVYVHYDPNYAFLSLGTYLILRIVAFVRHLQTMEPDIKYYYMGYYIRSCPKMNYKAKFYGSQLLCPETYLWYPMSHCIPLLDANEHTRFAARGVVDEDGTIDLTAVKILYEGQVMPYSTNCTLNPEAADQEEVREYAGFVGNKLASRMLLQPRGTEKNEKEPGND